MCVRKRELSGFLQVINDAMTIEREKVKACAP